MRIQTRLGALALVVSALAGCGQGASNQVASTASTIEPDTVTLPEGWKMDVPEGWVDLDTGKRARDPAAEAKDPPGTRYYRTADGVVHKQLPPLDAAGQKAVVEFNASRAAREQAKDDMREAVREELRAEELRRRN